MARLTERIANLGPGGALAWFLITGGLGAAAMLVGYHPTAAAITAVAVYASILILAQTRFFVYLNDDIKDSPYFMGYMLTLVGLMRVFHGAFLEQAPNREALLSGTGSALWASAVGLVARHIVFSLDQTERSRTPLFKGLMDELREQATAFRQAQFRLLKLVNDFAERREGLLLREQEAVQLYVERLEAGTATLGAIAKEYPDAVTRLAAKIAAATETVKETTTATKDALEQMRATVETRLQQQAHESSTAMGIATQTVAQTREALERDLLAIRTQLSALADSVGVITRQAGQLVTEVGAVSTSLTTLPDELRTRMTSQDEAARQSLDASRTLLEQAAADMRQIDQVVTDLAKVLPEHLRELVAEP